MAPFSHSALMAPADGTNVNLVGTACRAIRCSTSLAVVQTRKGERHLFCKSASPLFWAVFCLITIMILAQSKVKAVAFHATASGFDD
jgi:hypothetical protein